MPPALVDIAASSTVIVPAQEAFHVDGRATSPRKIGGSRLSALPLLARTRYEWSTILLDRGRKGDRRRAAEWRRKSEELATRLGMTRLLEELATSRH